MEDGYIDYTYMYMQDDTGILQDGQKIYRPNTWYIGMHINGTKTLANL